QVVAEVAEPREERTRVLRFLRRWWDGHQADRLDPFESSDGVDGRGRLPGANALPALRLVDLDQHRDDPAVRAGAPGQTLEGAAGRCGVHDVGEVGDAVRGVALQRADVVPSSRRCGVALGRELLRVVLAEVAHAGVVGRANHLAGD